MSGLTEREILRMPLASFLKFGNMLDSTGLLRPLMESAKKEEEKKLKEKEGNAMLLYKMLEKTDRVKM